MRVLKFGGTSVADAAAIDRLTAIVAARRGPRVVVVSALAGITDALLTLSDTVLVDRRAAQATLSHLLERHAGLIRTLRDPMARRFVGNAAEGIAKGVARTLDAIADARLASPACVDRLLAAGELWSSRIVAARLEDAGVSAQWVDARHVIRTDAHHRCAGLDRETTDRAVERSIRPALALDRVVVLGGFIGSGPDGATTTLGRGGSDYSAAIVGASLHADEIEIWTDVDGVLSADPRVVAGARVVPALSYEDAATLAMFGAKVLHPKTLEPAAAREIPVRVLNSRRPHAPGTRIDALGATGFAAVASRTGIRLVDLVARSTLDGAFAARALQALADARIHIIVGEVHPDRLRLAVDGRFEADPFRARVDSFAELHVRDGFAAVCAVGDRFSSSPGFVAEAMSAFDDGRVHLVSRPPGSQAFAVVVDDEDALRFVCRLHDRFAASEPAEVAS
jgi:aspartate kinase